MTESAGQRSGRDERLLRAAVVAAVVLLLALALLVVRPPQTGLPVDGSAGDSEGVSEPDGVRGSPAPVPGDLDPTPVVPEEAGAQQ
jgi:hypothetical protein